MITTICKLSYSSRTVPPIVQAVQGDTGRTVRFDVTDFTIPAGAEATYFIEKPSGEAVYNAATISGNSILCELTAQSLAEPGENKMQVRVILNDEIVTSFKVCLLVSTFWGIDAIESSTEMNIFDQAVEQATEQFQENAEQIVEEVIESIPADYTALTEEVDELNERIDDIVPGLSEDAKTALLACFQHVAFLDDDDDYYTNLRDALYASDELVSLSAVFNQGSTIIYPDEPLDNLQTMLVVTGLYADDNTKVINDYRLSGTLVGDTLSTITVSYRDKTTTFAVAVTDYEWGSDYTWLYRADTDGLLSENENVSATVGINGIPATESLEGDIFNVSAPYASTGTGNVYKLIPITGNGVLKAKVRFNALAKSTAPSGFRIQVSNGTNGAQMFAYKNALDDTHYRIDCIAGNEEPTLANIELNRWYILSCELDGNKQVVKVDNSTYTYNALSSYANTETRVIVQQPGGESDVGNVDVDIAWISFKNNA